MLFNQRKDLPRVPSVLISSASVPPDCIWSTPPWSVPRTCASKKREWETCSKTSSCPGTMPTASWCRTSRDCRRYVIWAQMLFDEALQLEGFAPSAQHFYFSLVFCARNSGGKKHNQIWRLQSWSKPHPYTVSILKFGVSMFLFIYFGMKLKG